MSVFLEKLKVKKEYDALLAQRDELAKGLEEEFKKEGKSTLTDEEFTKGAEEVEKLDEAIKSLKEELVNLEKQEAVSIKQRENLVNKSLDSRKSIENDDPRGTKEYLEAWAKSVREQDGSYFKEASKSISTTTTDGITAGAFGAVVPTYVAEEIERAMSDFGGLFNWANITTVKGLLQIPVEVFATDAEEHEEGTPAPDEEEITIDQIIVKPKMVKKWITWTDEIAIMSAVDLVAYIKNEFIEKIVMKTEKLMLNGTDETKGIYGIIPAGNDANNPRVVKFNGNGVLGQDTISKMVGKARAGKRPLRWFMHRETFYGNVRTITDTTNRPIYSIDNVTGQPQIEGILVEFDDNMVTYDNATATDVPIILQAQGAYRLNLPNGKVPNFITDPYSMSEEDKTKFTGKLFAGGTPTKIAGTVMLVKGIETP